jgi:hypothetical protein
MSMIPELQQRETNVGLIRVGGDMGLKKRGIPCQLADASVDEPPQGFELRWHFGGK